MVAVIFLLEAVHRQLGWYCRTCCYHHKTADPNSALDHPLIKSVDGQIYKGPASCGITGAVTKGNKTTEEIVMCVRIVTTIKRAKVHPLTTKGVEHPPSTATALAAVCHTLTSTQRPLEGVCMISLVLLAAGFVDALKHSTAATHND